MTQRFFLFYVSLFFSFNVQAQYSRIEENTIQAGFETLQWMQFLHATSKKCNHFEYAEQAPKQELSNLVEKKLGVPLEKLEILAEENEAYITSLYKHINAVDCNQVDVPVLLSRIYDNYDVAKFNFELFEPISQPIITQRELAYQTAESLKKYLREKAVEADTVAIAEIIPWEDASIKYRKQFAKSDYKPDYLFRLTKGWKEPKLYQYLSPPSSIQTSLKSGEYKQLIKKKGKIRKLLFMKNDTSSYMLSHIIGAVNLEEFDVDLSFLKKHQWEWVGDTLIK